MKFIKILLVSLLVLSSSMYGRSYGDGKISNCILSVKRTWDNGSLSSYQPVKGIAMIVETGKDGKIQIGNITVKHNEKIIKEYFNCNK